MPRRSSFLEQRAGVGADVGALQVQQHAGVESAEQQAVAVALQAFEQPMPDRPFDVGPRTEAVGDERREGLVAVRQLEEVAGRHVHRHPDALAVARPHGLDPGEGRFMRDRAAGGKAERQRVGDAVATEGPDHGVGAVDAARLVAQPQRRADHFGDFRHGADDRLGIGRAVAVARRHGAAELQGFVQKQTHHPGGHARAVERRHGETGEAALGQGVDVALGRLGQVGRQVVHGWFPASEWEAAER